MRFLATTLLLLFVMYGCASHPSMQPPSEELLRSGDCLLIEFPKRETPGIRRVIDSSGDIDMPLLGKLHLAGLTLQQAQTLIETAYRGGGPILPVYVSVSRCR
jgi:protein involved in polysaccharide export with SLBB domain